MKPTGIIFIDIFKDRRWPSPKFLAFFAVLVMVFTSFAMLNFSFSPQAAASPLSPPLTGDKAFSNASLYGPYVMVQNGTGSSWSIIFNNSGTYQAYVNGSDSATHKATSNTVGQTVSPSAPLYSSEETQNNISFREFTTYYYTYFNETGFPSGKYWYVIFNGNNYTTNTNSIKIPETVRQSYSYSIPDSHGYAGSPSSGSIEPPATVSITFSPTFSPLSVTIASSQSTTDYEQSVTFTATASNGWPAYSYNFYIDSSSVQSGSSNTYTTSSLSVASHSVYVVATDSDGDTATSSTITQTVDAALTVSVSPSKSPIDSGQSVTFTATASGGSGTYSSYQWYNGGTAVSGATSSTWTTTSLTSSSGETVYSIRVTVTDTNGYTSPQSSPFSEDVYSLPTTSISSNYPNGVGINVAVTFTATASSGYGSFTYSFTSSDGGSSGSISTNTWSHAFTSVGSYTVSVTVTDANGGQASASMSQTIVALTVTVSPNYNPTDVGVSVTWTAYPSGGSGTYSHYAFYLNGVFQINQTTSSWAYTDNSQGTYTVYVIVTDSSGHGAQSSTITETVNYDPSSGGVTISPNPSVPNYAFSITGYVDYGTAPYTYYFYTSSGTLLYSTSSSSTSLSYSLSEASAGSYSFYVTIVDNVGRSATSSTYTETVNPLVSVTLASSLNPSQKGTAVTFTATGSGGSGSYTNYQFYINGSSVQSGASSTLTYTFNGAANYSVYVVITDSFGYTNPSNTITQQVVSGLFTVTLASSSPTSIVGQKVWFNATAHNGTAPYTFQFYIKIVSETFSVRNFTYTITQNVNEFNSSYVYFNYTILDGVTFPNVNLKTTVTNLTYVDPSAPVAHFGIGSSNFAFGSLAYYSAKTSYNLTGYDNVTSASSVSLKFFTNEIVNYVPIISSQPVASFVSNSTTGAEASVSFATSEQFTGENEDITVSWGDGTHTVLTNVAFGSFTKYHNYEGSYSGSITEPYSISFTVTNLPYGGSPYQESLTSHTATFSFSTVLTPSTPTTFIQAGQYVWLNYSASNLVFSSVTGYVDGVQASIVQVSTYSYKLTSPEFTLNFGAEVLWSLKTSDPVYDNLTVQYSSPYYPTNNSSWVSALFSKSATNSYPIAINSPPTIQSYPISITGAPSGSGYYQQLLTVPLTSYINPSLGNFYFTTTSGTELYAWVQSYNSSSMQVWVKTPNGTSQVNLITGFPNSFYSANGYIGEAPQLSPSYGEYFNAQNVFPFATDFSGSGQTLSSSVWNNIGYGGGSGIVNNGLNLTYQTYESKQTFNTVNSGLIWNVEYTQNGTSENQRIGFASTYVINKHYIQLSNTTGSSTSLISFTGSTVSWNSFRLFQSPNDTYNLYENGTIVSTATLASMPTTDNIYLQSLYANYSLKMQYLAYFAAPSSMPTFTIGPIISASQSIQQTAHYQQLLTFSNPSNYGINSQGSNFYITYTNGTPVYSWIQSINSSDLVVWSKLPFGTSSVNLEVFPTFENLLSANGYLGYNTTYFNAPKVFPFAHDFRSGVLKGFTTYYPSALSFGSYGLKILDISSSLTVFSNISEPWNSMVLWAGSFDTGTLSNSISQGSTSGTLYLSFQFLGNIAVAFNWYNKTTNPEVLFYGNTGSSGSAVNYKTNTYQEYSVSLNESNGNIYEYGYLNNIYQQYAYKDNFTSTGSFGFFTQQTSVAYEIWNYVIEMNETMNSMPTFTIGSGSVFQANATVYNTTHWGHTSYSIDPYNQSEADVFYTIPDSFNSSFVSIYYALGWKLVYASYVYTYGTVPREFNFVNFLHVGGIGQINLEFIEPMTAVQDFSTVSIQVDPSIAIGGFGFFNFPSNYLTWYANGRQVNPNGFSVLLDTSTRITAKSGIGNVTVYSTMIDPTTTTYFFKAYVNVTQIEFSNYSPYHVTVYATLNGSTQGEVQLSTGQTGVYDYMPSGTYNWTYDEWSNSTFPTLIKSVSTSPAYYNGMAWIDIYGNTIYTLNNQLKYTNSTIHTAIQNLTVTVTLNDASIKNLTLGVDFNLTTFNTSIQNVLTKIISNETFIKSYLNDENISFTDKILVLKGEIGNFQNNITVWEMITNNTINYIKSNVIKLNQNLTAANTTIGLIKTIARQNFTLINSTLRNNYIGLIAQVNNLNSSTTAQLLNIVAEVNNTHSALMKQLIYVLANITNSNSSAVLQYVNLYDSIRNLNSTMAFQYIGVGQQISQLRNATVGQYLSLEQALADATGSLQPLTYQFIVQNGTYTNGIYQIPVVILNWQDNVLPTNYTISLIRNLTVKLMSGGSTTGVLPFRVKSINEHGFILDLTVTPAILQEINTKGAFLLLSSSANNDYAAGIVSNTSYKSPLTLEQYLNGFVPFLETPNGTLLLTFLMFFIYIGVDGYLSSEERKTYSGGKR